MGEDVGLKSPKSDDVVYGHPPKLKLKLPALWNKVKIEYRIT